VVQNGFRDCFCLLNSFLIGMNYTALMKLKKMFFMVYLSSVSKHGPKNFFFFFYRLLSFIAFLYFINKLKVNMKP